MVLAGDADAVGSAAAATGQALAVEFEAAGLGTLAALVGAFPGGFSTPALDLVTAILDQQIE